MENIEKSIIIFDELMYPNNLFNCINNQIKNKQMSALFFGGDYIRLISIFDTNKKRLDENTWNIQVYFKQMVEQNKLLILDDEETRLELESIKKQIQNGIPEKAFYDWFMRLSFCCRQLTVPLDTFGEPKEGYSPSSKTLEIEFNNGSFQNYVFFSSNGKLLNEITLNELVKKAEEKIKRDLINKNKTVKQKRNPLDSRLRHECFKRDNYTCKECGATHKEKMLHCDHIIPVSQGGSDELSNLQTLCDDCNLAKSDKCFRAGEVKEVKDGERNKTD
jgi:hypothetical protein